MSVASCTAFLEHSQADPALAGHLRAITDTRELIALASRHGYSFDVDELVTASSMLPVAPQVESPRRADTHGGGRDTTFHHYEFELDGIPAMAPLAAELAHLTIRPASVDLEAFHAASRRDDLNWTSMSPAAPEFGERYDEIMQRHWDGSSGRHHERRDFHLVNLDQHVDHPLYEDYFESKLRTMRHLENVFGCEIRFSGSMWYPAFSYRLWHTNETQPGWRMYLVDFDEPVADADMRSFFRYMNPRTKELVTLRDRPKMLRIFKVDQRPDQLLWHCIVNGAERNRWSFGFAVPDDWMDRLSPLLDDTATPTT